MPTNEYTPDIAALKSGLPVFYGRILTALERIADAIELANAASNAKARVSARGSANG